jgi:predicted phage terminase large subunit-like protein
MKEIPGFPQFEIIRYPAVAEQDEYEDPSTWDVYRLDPETGDIVEGRLPALPEGAELIRRKGEALDKGRYPLAELMAIKATLLPRHWSALYQQNPVPDEGIFFHKDQFQATDMTRGWGDCYIVQAWDFAISTTQEADFTVGATVAYAPDGTKHILEVKRFKAETHTIVTEMIDMFVRWKTAGVVQPMLSFENGQIWKTLKPVLKAEMKRRGVTFSVDGPDVEQQPVTDKKVRARAFQGEMQAFRVFWNTAASWYAKCYAELMRFPAGTHDDQVDALAWAFKRIMLMSAPAPLAGRKRKKKDEKTVAQKLNDLRRGVTEGSTAMAA